MWHWFDLGKNRVSTSSRSPRFSRRFMCPLRQARRRPQLRCPSPISLPLAALWTAWGWIGFNVHVCFAAFFVLKFKLDLKVGILIVPRFKHNENTDSVKSKLIQHVTSTGMWTKAGYNHTVHSTFVHVAKVYIARYHAFIKKFSCVLCQTKTAAIRQNPIQFICDILLLIFHLICPPKKGPRKSQILW